MVDQPHGRPAVADRHRQRILAQDALQPLGHRPADDLHRGQILDGGEVEPAFVSWDVGDVSEPDRIGRNGSEVAVKQIGRDRMGVAAVGGDWRPPPASRWTNAVLSHELGDRALRDAKAAGLQLGMDPRGAVAPLALLEDLPDLRPEPATPGSAFSSLLGRTPPGVEPTVSNLQDPAHEPDGVPRSMGGDESVLRFHAFAAH